MTQEEFQTAVINKLGDMERSISLRLDKIELRLDKIEYRLDKIESRLDRIEKFVATDNADFDPMKKEKAA